MKYKITYYMQGAERFTPDYTNNKKIAAQLCRDFVSNWNLPRMKKAGYKLIHNDNCYRMVHPVFGTDSQAQFVTNEV